MQRTAALLALMMLLPLGLRGQHPMIPTIDPLDPDPQPFDVIHYAPTLDLRDAPARTMSGLCTITLVWQEISDPLFRFNLRDLEIDSIDWSATTGSDPVRVVHETIGTPDDPFYHHQISPPTTPSAGDTARVTIWYHGQMTDEFGPGRWGGVSSGSGVLYAMGVGFSNNYVSATQHWMPCYDHPSDKATFTGRFRIPEGMMVASNGLPVEKIEEEDGSSTWVWDHVHPAATYLLTFAVAPYVELDVGPVELPMLLYALPTDSAMTRRSFSQLPKMVDWFEQHFGDYPFEKVGYANTPQGAMEHQTMVSFPTSLSRTGDSLNLVGAHELAHQWFGDLVSPIDFRHAWLNESFATFCEALWLEYAQGGYQAYLGGITGNLQSYLGSDVVREGALPLYDFPRTSPSSNYPATIYNKGAVVVGMLRYELGETRFFTLMKRYLSEHAYGTASTGDLLALVEEVSGGDFDPFFDQWVVRKGWPIFEVTGRPGDGPGTFEITFRQVQPDDFGIFTNVPVEVGFVTPTGLRNRLVRVDSVEQSWTFDLGTEVEDLLFNQGPSLRTLAQFSVEISDVADGSARYSGLLYQARSSRDADRGFVVERRLPLPAGSTAVVSIYDTGGRLHGTTEVSSFPWYPTGPALTSGTWMVVVEEGESREVLPVIVRR